MDEEQAFITSLAADPFDPLTRLVYADWLGDWGRTDDEADQRALTEGYAALLANGIEAYQPAHRDNYWTYADYSCFEEDTSALPRDWFALIVAPDPECAHARSPSGSPKGTWIRWEDKAEADHAAALAFTYLPADRRAELLLGPVAVKLVNEP